MKHYFFQWKATSKTKWLSMACLAGFIQVTAFAQTNTFPTTGNVGIGTTAPAAVLDIQGGANDDGTKGKGLIAFQHWYYGGFRHWIATRHKDSSTPTIGNAIDFYLNNSASVTGSTAPGAGSVLGMSITTKGVGIGTNSPAQKLDVNGTIQATGFKLPTGAGEGKVLVSDAAGVASWTTLIGSGSGSTNGWTLNGSNPTTTGSVGIGTPTPTQKLDVRGDASINGVLIGKGAGTYSTRLGEDALANALNTGAGANTAIGFNALFANTSGIQNTAIGSSALRNVTTGSSNIAIGIAALSATNGSNNVAIGSGAGSSQTAGDYNILIGAGVALPDRTGSNQLNIGNLIYGTGMAGSLAGNIGIGTTTPTQKLDVAGTVKATQFNMPLPSSPEANTQYIPKADANGNMVWTKFRDMHEIYSSTWVRHVSANGFKLVATGGTGADTLGMRLDARGGLWSDGGYSCWPNKIPDYVFEADYSLMPLAETEQFIKTQKHLPGIPSEAEYKKRGGVELYELSMKLLEKVEELTLHLIEQDKEKETLKTKMTALQQELNALRKH